MGLISIFWHLRAPIFATHIKSWKPSSLVQMPNRSQFQVFRCDLCQWKMIFSVWRSQSRCPAVQLLRNTYQYSFSQDSCKKSKRFGLIALARCKLLDYSSFWWSNKHILLVQFSLVPNKQHQVQSRIFVSIHRHLCWVNQTCWFNHHFANFFWGCELFHRYPPFTAI